jgi:hypothetical protein
MKASLTMILGSRVLTLSVHVLLWVLLYLTVVGLRGTAPPYRETAAGSESVRNLKPVVSLHRLYAAATPPMPVATNAMNAFYTRYFIPSPAPAPPAPTTKKIELVYQGFYEAGPGPKQVVVKMGERILISPVGSRLTANLYAAQASITSLLLTNTAAATNVLPLNIGKQIEVPIQ